MSSARKTFGIIIAVSIIAYVALALSDHFTNNVFPGPSFEF